MREIMYLYYVYTLGVNLRRFKQFELKKKLLNLAKSKEKIRTKIKRINKKINRNKNLNK